MSTIERGTLFQTDPQAGAWRQLGQKGIWAGTAALAAMDGRLWSIEDDGTLYRTDQQGRYEQVGRKGAFRHAHLLAAMDRKLWTVENGTLYSFDPTVRHTLPSEPRDKSPPSAWPHTPREATVTEIPLRVTLPTPQEARRSAVDALIPLLDLQQPRGPWDVPPGSSRRAGGISICRDPGSPRELLLVACCSQEVARPLGGHRYSAGSLSSSSLASLYTSVVLLNDWTSCLEESTFTPMCWQSFCNI
jgi:hypothetical protein